MEFMIKQDGDNDMYWKYEVVDGLDITDPTKLVQTLRPSSRTFSVSENEARIVQLQSEIDKLKAENALVEDEKNFLKLSLEEVKQQE